MGASNEHTMLVKAAELWLRSVRRRRVVISDHGGWVGPERPDVIGWVTSGASTVIECKASRADFVIDAKKQVRRRPGTGMGRERYFFVPQGLIARSELPRRWGLIELSPLNQPVVRVVAKPFKERNELAEQRLLIKAVRRATEGWSLQIFGEHTPNASEGELAIMHELRGKLRRTEAALREAHVWGCSTYSRYMLANLNRSAQQLEIGPFTPGNTVLTEQDAREERADRHVPVRRRRWLWKKFKKA